MTTLTRRARVLWAPFALLVSMPAACHLSGNAGDVAAPPPSRAPALGSSAEVSAHGVGPAEPLLEAAEGLQLTESQREKVRALKAQLSKYEQNAHAAFRALREDVADQVRAGAIVTASVKADEDRAAGALTVHVDESAEAMNALYATLDPSQRAAVVAAVRAMHPGRAEAQKPGDATSPFEEPLEPMDAILDGFAGGRFEGWTTVPSPLAPPAEAFRQRIDREVGDLARLVPALRPDQRERLAATIEGQR